MTSSVNKLIGTFAQTSVQIDTSEFLNDNQKCIIIDTSENRIGINTIYPQYEIDVSGGGTIKTDNLIINKLIINNLPSENNISDSDFPVGTVYSDGNYFLKIKT
tara:strand:+ start:861 stop:1172 length:312 start_codon:yes stop_codon:yes gene_type:complete